MRMQSSSASSTAISKEPIAGSAVVQTASRVVQMVRRGTAQAVGLQWAVAVLAFEIAAVAIERASTRRACEALVYQWTAAGEAAIVAASSSPYAPSGQAGEALVFPEFSTGHAGWVATDSVG